MTVYTFEKWQEGKIKKRDGDCKMTKCGGIAISKLHKSGVITSWHGHDDWAETEEEARDMLIARKEKKIQSLKKQIAKLEALTEWEVQ